LVERVTRDCPMLTVRDTWSRDRLDTASM
jgi:hypothetical protein